MRVNTVCLPSSGHRLIIHTHAHAHQCEKVVTEGGANAEADRKTLKVEVVKSITTAAPPRAHAQQNEQQYRNCNIPICYHAGTSSFQLKLFLPWLIIQFPCHGRAGKI